MSKPVEIEFLLKDGITANLDKIKAGTDALGKKATLTGAEYEKLGQTMLNLRGSIAILEQNLNDLRMAGESASPDLDQAENISKIEALEKHIKELEAELKRLQTVSETVKVDPPELPRAEKRFNGLHNSIQQMAREMPTLAMGPQMFFMAISNNLPIFADELARARAEYDGLVKSGQKGVPVWKQVLSSLFSWQTALTTGIMLLTMYGDKIVEWAKGLFSAKKGVEEFTISLEEMAEIEKDGRAQAVRTRFELDTLATSLKNFTGTRDEERAKVEELNRKYGESFGYYDTLAQWYDTITRKGADYIQMLFLQAKVQSLVNKAAEADAKVNEIDAAPDEEYDSWWGQFGKLGRLTNPIFWFNKSLRDFNYGGAARAGAKKAEEAKRDAYLEEAKRLQEEQNRLARESGFGGHTKPTGPGNDPTAAALRQAQEDARKAETDNERARIADKIKLLEFDKEQELAAIDERVKAVKSAEEKAALERLKSAKETGWNEQIAKEREEAEKKLAKVQRDEEKAWNEYNIKYGKYQEKRLAITRKYEEEIAGVQKGSAEEATLLAEQKAELDALDEELMKSSGLWGDLLSDFSNRSSSAIRGVLVDIQALIDYMNGVEGAEMPDLFADSEKTVKAVNAAMSDPTAREKFTSGLSDTMKKFRKMLDENNPFKQIEDGWKNKDPESMKKGLDGISSAVGELQGLLSDLGVEADSTAGKVTSVVGDTASFAAQGAAVGGPWGAVVGGALGLAKGLVGVLGADYSAYNKMKEEYGELVDVWDTLIDKKQKYIDISYGDEARKAAREVEDLLNRKTEADVALGLERLNSGSSAGSHSIGVRQRKNMSDKGWEELRKAAGDIGFNYDAVAGGRMEGLFDLTARQLEDLQDKAPTFWAQLDEDVKGYLQDIIDCNTAIEENRQKMQETLTGVSFDSFYDNFVSMLSDMEKSSEDFADSFGDYLRNALLQNLLANKYKQRIQELYDAWVAKSDSDGDGVLDLTSTEAEELKKAQQALADQLLAERDALAETFQWESGGTSQTGRAGAFTAMSQDQGTKLEGMFTSGLNHWISIDERMESVADRMTAAETHLARIAENTGKSAGLLGEIKEDIKKMIRDGLKMK